ncbi:ATP-binding protein [Mycolicibacterium sp. Dal123E01]|uniref:ATP-binding protein n=1 Tax=Mycolicibacterium sp. Dal123E01 TaxID=3457578 RepID=UPI00403E78E8
MAVPVRLFDDPDERPPTAGSALRLQILGPLRIWRDDAELDAGPRQQAFLLALLLARAGRPTSTDELVSLMWGEHAPASALNVVHKYVGTLRRLLEPTLPPRGSGSHLLRRGNGYLFTAGEDTLDLARFRQLVGAAEAAVVDRDQQTALDHYVAALGLWTGPAGDGLGQAPGSVSVFARLNGEFFDACVVAAHTAVAMGQPERVLGPLQLAATIEPLHEPIHAGLIAALGAAGRQGEALSVYGGMRARLAEELGIDPSTALRTAQHHVLTQTHAAAPVVETVMAASLLIGRTDELGVLRRAIEPSFTGGNGLVIVEGEPGVGKTRLLEEAAAEADRRGALAIWGSCLQGDGTPSMWPWVQAAGTVVDALPAAARAEWLDGDLGRLVDSSHEILSGSVLPDSGAQFRLFESVVAVVAEVARRQPLVLVIDDLHWADAASLQLFIHLATRLPGSTVVIGALRDRAPSPGSELARMLAAASRVPGHRRVALGPLELAEVAELVRRETGYSPTVGAVRGIYDRTAGNPFFVRELARFLADGGELSADAAAHTGVPATVRDVVRDRLTGLDDSAKHLLQVAALIGRDVGLALVGRAADCDVPTCLDHLEPLVALGLLEPTPREPYSFRFSHDLVRESVAGIIPPARATELHLRIADALELTHRDDESVAERLAFHLWSAGPLADPARTARALLRAGSRAMAKSALESAERQLRASVQVAREAGLAELELSALSQLTAVVGMRSMYGAASVDLLERAEQLARGLGRELEAAGFLFSRWTAHQQGIELDRSGPLARQLLEQGNASDDPLMRTFGLQAWGLHQWDVGNINEAFRYLTQSERTVLAGFDHLEDDPVRGDLQLLMTGMLRDHRPARRRR